MFATVQALGTVLRHALKSGGITRDFKERMQARIPNQARASRLRSAV
jgi:hypothetical protein